jgi:predicted permease
MRGGMSITELVLVINFPIFLGWGFKQLRIFKEDEIGTIRKFVVKVTVPFIIFKNLYYAQISDISQLIPASTAFVIITVQFAIAVVVLRKLISPENKISNSFCLATFMGNYGYLGWGVLYYFYGDSGFTRAVFFTVFFWPVFLFSGLVLISFISGQKFDKSFIKTIGKALLDNALIPIIVVIAALYMNYEGIVIPLWLKKSIDSFSAITIPAILFSVGLSFSLFMNRKYLKAVIAGTVIRLGLGMIFGLVAVMIVSLFYSADSITKKVILIESVMPSAAISPFFADFIDSEKEVISGILTFSTIISLFTLPFWYSLIEKWSLF